MTRVLFVLFSIVLHAAFYSLQERFSVLTVIFSVIWAGISFGVFQLVYSFTGKNAVRAPVICSLSISAIYFLVFYFYGFSSFSELKIHGIEIVHHKSITASGVVYLTVMALGEAVIFLLTLALAKMVSRRVGE